MVEQSVNLFLVLIYILSLPKEVWYVQLVNRYIPSQWHCVSLKHIWMCVFFLYFVKTFTILPKRPEIIFRQHWAHSSCLLEHTTCACSPALFSAELAGHLLPWLLVHSSFCALPLPMPSGFSSSVPDGHQLTIFHFQPSVSPRLKPPQRSKQLSSMWHTQSSGWHWTPLSSAKWASIRELWTLKWQELSWGFLKLNTQTGAG